MRKYLIELFGAFIGYAASLLLASYIVGYHDLGDHEELWAALIPMPSTILIAWVIWRNLRLMDEMQWRIQAESLALALGMTGLITFNYGFLEGAGFPRQSAFWVWPIMAVSWGFAQILVYRRY